jgi:hypothetical protein
MKVKPVQHKNNQIENVLDTGVPLEITELFARKIIF